MGNNHAFTIFLDNGFLPFIPLLASRYYLERDLKRNDFIQSLFSFEYVITSIKCLNAVPKPFSNTKATAEFVLNSMLCEQIKGIVTGLGAIHTAG